MPTYRVYISYSPPECFDGEADDENEAVEIVSDEIMELVDLGRVKFKIEELEEGGEEAEEEDRGVVGHA